MTFRHCMRVLSATMLLGLAVPVLAQAQPVFKPGTGATQPPVLPTEPPVNEPAAPVAEPQIVTPAPPLKPVKKKGPIDALKPGQFVWEKRDSYEGPLKIVAVLDIQRAVCVPKRQAYRFQYHLGRKKG